VYGLQYVSKIQSPVPVSLRQKRGRTVPRYTGMDTFFATNSMDLLCFSTKAVIFVRLFPYGEVFAVCQVRSDTRKPTVGLFRLHRLLYFTRAVGSPTRGSHNVRVGNDKRCTVHTTASYTANVNQTNWRDRYDDSDLWIPVQLFLS